MPRTVGVAVSHAAFHFDKLYTYAVMPDQQDQEKEHEYRVEGGFRPENMQKQDGKQRIVQEVPPPEAFP